LTHELVDAAVLGQSGVNVAARINLDAMHVAALQAVFGSKQAPALQPRDHFRAAPSRPARSVPRRFPGFDPQTALAVQIRSDQR
jgi:hypothetical protein